MSIEFRSKGSSATDGMREHIEQGLDFAIDYSSVVMEFHDCEAELYPPTADEEAHPPG